MRSNFARDIVLYSALVLALIGAAAAGYHWLEGWSWLDSLYMSVMVLTTVGFNEIEPPTPTGKLYSSFVMLAGIGMMLFLLSRLAETALRRVTDPREVRRREERRLMKLREHVVVCGFGQVGEAAAMALRDAGRTVVVIDMQEARLEVARAAGMYTELGDATDEVVLRRAATTQAVALVSALDSDPDNLYVVLTARGLSETLHIVARASGAQAARNMRRAGADDVVNPHRLSGDRIASLMLTPHMSGLLHGAHGGEGFTVREIVLPERRHGQTIQQLGSETGALVVAIWRGGQPMRPQAGDTVQRGDTLLLVGERAQVERV